MDMRQVEASGNKSFRACFRGPLLSRYRSQGQIRKFVQVFAGILAPEILNLPDCPYFHYLARRINQILAIAGSVSFLPNPQTFIRTRVHL